MPGFDALKTINMLCGVKNQANFDHFYSITPTNFMILSDDKQFRKLGDFFQLLRILQKQVMITLTRTPIMVPYKGKETRMDVLQVYLDSTEPSMSADKTGVAPIIKLIAINNFFIGIAPLSLYSLIYLVLNSLTLFYYPLYLYLVKQLIHGTSYLESV